MIPSTVSTDTIFLILSSPYGCIWLTSLNITPTQGRLYVPSVTSSMNSLSSSSFLDMDRDLFFRHRSWTWTESYSFEQDTSQTWCHIETSAVKKGATNVWDNAILPPTVSGDGTGACFFGTDCVRRCRWCTLLWATAFFTSLFRGMSSKDSQIFWKSFFCPFLLGETLSHGTRKSRWSRVGTSKIILDFNPVICLVRWIMVRLGKVGRVVVKKLNYQW